MQSFQGGRKCGIKGHFERFCNKEKKVAANIASQTEGAATDTTKPVVRETSAMSSASLLWRCRTGLVSWSK